MKRIILAVMLVSTPAMAAKPSILCKAKDNDTMFSVVVVDAGKILFQMDAGEYLEGVGTMVDKDRAAFVVHADNGNVYMVLDGRDNNGLVKLEYNDGRMRQHPIHCVYK